MKSTREQVLRRFGITSDSVYWADGGIKAQPQRAWDIDFINRATEAGNDPAHKEPIVYQKVGAEFEGNTDPHYRDVKIVMTRFEGYRVARYYFEERLVPPPTNYNWQTQFA